MGTVVRNNRTLQRFWRPCISITRRDIFIVAILWRSEDLFRRVLEPRWPVRLSTPLSLIYASTGGIAPSWLFIATFIVLGISENVKG